MWKEKITMGDRVRWVYPNYFIAMKCDYSQKIYWGNPEDNRENLMIGGEYEVIGIERDQIFFKMYKLNHCNISVTRKFIIKSTKDTTCPFQMNDEVFFRPKCSKKEAKYIEMANPTLNLNQKYKIVKIINNYYVVLNMPYPDEWKQYMPEDQIEDISIPFRWIDLEKA